MAEISVIIPVHNSRDYLAQCVESLLNQTFTDFEILLMENFSTDGTYEIAQSLAEKDSRIRLFKLDKKGICNARNEGIEKALGKYIVFMDNDDLVTEDHLQALYDCVSDGSCQMGIAPFAGLYSQGKVKKKIYHFPQGVYTDGSKACLMGERVVWSRIYSRQIINDNHVRFDDRVEAVEDWPFYFRMLLLSQGVKVTDKSCYYYRQGRQGQASAGSSLKSLKKNFLAVSLIKDMILNHPQGEIYKPYYHRELAHEIIGKTFAATGLKKLTPDEVGEIIEPLKDQLLSIRLNNDICESWLVTWFGYFQYWLKKGFYRRFFKFMRLYKNIIIQPFKIKLKK
ncbi:MAG: glycosyltransferase family 2 protein [Deferribacterales bacterium]|nr:glycosyltransferase family 2 protein [Deferribacterales bacterium]